MDNAIERLAKYMDYLNIKEIKIEDQWQLVPDSTSKNRNDLLIRYEKNSDFVTWWACCTSYHNGSSFNGTKGKIYLKDSEKLTDYLVEMLFTKCVELAKERALTKMILGLTEQELKEAKIL
jgi:hypothetical protein